MVFLAGVVVPARLTEEHSEFYFQRDGGPLLSRFTQFFVDNYYEVSGIKKLSKSI
ncbi:MAG: hypothetical protein CM1200mP40_33550 [Gammaproteobacteria bacterium]|nr:MAG: hypothetical protein CM1200mP40_33550 [Gammaproteobacteria bacterium]